MKKGDGLFQLIGERAQKSAKAIEKCLQQKQIGEADDEDFGCGVGADYSSFGSDHDAEPVDAVGGYA